MLCQTICKLSQWEVEISTNNQSAAFQPTIPHPSVFILTMVNSWAFIRTYVYKHCISTYIGFVCKSRRVVEVQRRPHIGHSSRVSVRRSGGRCHGEPRRRGHRVEAGDARTGAPPPETDTRRVRLFSRVIEIAKMHKSRQWWKVSENIFLKYCT